MMLVKIPKSFAVFAVLSAFGFILNGCGKGSPSGPPSGAGVEASVVRVEPQDIALATELPGRTSAYRTAEIRPQVNGIIQKRLFEEGSDVSAGQVLYQIEPAPFKAALDNAVAALARAEARVPAMRLRLERYRDLLVDKAVSRQDFDDAESAVKQADADVAYAKAAVEAAKINFGYTRVIAPISGRIGRSNVTDGALVTAHQPLSLATVQQLDPVFVDIPQSTNALLKLRRHLENGRLNQDGADQDRVKLILEDGTVYGSEGTLQFREVTVDPTTGSVILRAVFPNPESVLLPGMFVRAVVKEGLEKGAILIAQQAVARDPKGNPYVLTVGADQKAQQRMLTLDRAIGDRWLVVSGLQAGDQVIMENMQKLRPGAPVKPVLPGTAPAAGGAKAGTN